MREENARPLDTLFDSDEDKRIQMERKISVDATAFVPAMFSCKTCVKLLTIFLLSLLPAVRSQTLTANSSLFHGEHSESRQAYYRWRDWLMKHAVVLQKVPPVPKMNDSGLRANMDVFVNLTPVTIFCVDEARQTVMLSLKLEFFWKDPTLAVTKELAELFTEGNVTNLPLAIGVPSRVLWLPSVVLVEGVDFLRILEGDFEAVITQDGTVSMDMPYIFTFTCQFDMTSYPFDEHSCPITFFETSYTVDMYPVPLPWDLGFRDQFGVNGEWDLVSVKNRTLYTWSNQRGPYPQFVLHIRRKTMFYVVMVLLPLVSTSYLNLLVFFLPPDLGDKVSYLVTLTVSLSVFTSIFSADMPRGLTSTPTIFIFLLYVYSEGFVVLVMSLGVLRKYKLKLMKEADAAPSSYSSATFSTSRFSTEHACQGTDYTKTQEKGKMTAARLDAMFFLISFVGNTVGLVCILASL